MRFGRLKENVIFRQIFENNSMMHQLNDFLARIDGHIGGSQWFVFLLLGTGVFFTIYLKFPQFRYLKHSLRIVMGKFDKEGDKGDTPIFRHLPLRSPERSAQETSPALPWPFTSAVRLPFLDADDRRRGDDHQIRGGHPVAQIP
jgi:hypothetical protein